MSIACYHLNGQDLEPRRYAALPKKLNALAFVYGLSRGNVVSDPSLPLSDFTITAHTFGFGYARTFGLAGKLARVVLTIPYTSMSGNLTINGRDTSGVKSGFNDAQLRFGINLTGSPALDRKEFAHYTQKTILGLSMVVNMPTGLYHKSKLINTGTNRWAFKPEVGVSKRFKRIYVEAYTGVWFFMDNKEFLGNKKQEQKPMFSLQAHGTYYFKNGMWVSINGTRFNGGETIIDNVAVGDLFDNWRVGATWSVPVAAGHSIKLQGHVGAFATRGYNYSTVLLAFSYVFF